MANLRLIDESHTRLVQSLRRHSTETADFHAIGSHVLLLNEYGGVVTVITEREFKEAQHASINRTSEETL